MQGCGGTPTEVIIPKSVVYEDEPYTVTYVESEAFSGCSYITNITLPESVTRIGHGAFGYSGLTSIALPESVNYIGNRAFSVCI